MKRGKKGNTIRRQGALTRLLKHRDILVNDSRVDKNDPRLIRMDTEIARLQELLK